MNPKWEDSVAIDEVQDTPLWEDSTPLQEDGVPLWEDSTPISVAPAPAPVIPIDFQSEAKPERMDLTRATGMEALVARDAQQTALAKEPSGVEPEQLLPTPPVSKTPPQEAPVERDLTDEYSWLDAPPTFKDQNVRKIVADMVKIWKDLEIPQEQKSEQLDKMREGALRIGASEVEMAEEQRKVLPGVRELMATEESVAGDVLRTMGGAGTSVMAMGNALVQGLAELPVGGPEKAREWLRGNARDLAEQSANIMEDIGKQGGIPAQVAQEIGQQALTTAIRLAMLKGTGLMGSKSMILNAVKMGVFTAATTSGTAAERAKAGARAATLMATPLLAGKMPTAATAVLLDTALNIGLSNLYGFYDWSDPKVWIPALMMDVAFAASTRPGMGASDRARIDSVVNRVRNAYVKAVGAENAVPEMRKAGKRVGMSSEQINEFVKPLTKGFKTPEELAKPLRVEVPKEMIPAKVPTAAKVDVAPKPIRVEAPTVTAEEVARKPLRYKVLGKKASDVPLSKVNTETANKEALTHVGWKVGNLAYGEWSPRAIFRVDKINPDGTFDLFDITTNRSMPNAAPADSVRKQKHVPSYVKLTPEIIDLANKDMWGDVQEKSQKLYSEMLKTELSPKGITEEAPSAIQKPSAEKVVLRQPPKVSEEAGKAYPEGKAVTEAREAAEAAKPTEAPAPISKKELITKSLPDLKKSIEPYKVKTEDMGRKEVVDEIQTRQNEAKADKLIDDIPVPETAKRKRGLRNGVGAIGFEKPTRVSVPSSKGDVVKTERMFEKQRADVESKFKLTIGKMRDRISAATFGSDVPVTRRLWDNNGREVVWAKALSRGWGTKAGREFNEAESNIKDTVPHRLDDLFDDFVQAKRTIEVSNLMREKRATQKELFAEGELPEVIKSPAGLGAKANQTWLDELRRQRPQDYVGLEVAHEKWKAVMRKQVDKLFGAGLIDKDMHSYLVKNHPNFSPRRFIQHIDPTIDVAIGGRKITVRDSGIESLDTGSEKSLINNSTYLLDQTISGIESRIAKNKANKSLYDYVSKNPENALGAKLESDAEAKGAVPSGNTRLSVMIDGKPKTLVAPSDIMQYWVASDPQMKAGTARFLQYATGVKVVKALATGYNPEFAVSNIPRDMAHYALVTQEYNPILPIAWAQQVKDMATVLPDVLARKGRVDDYIDDGGGMEFLSTQGQFGKKPGIYGSVHNEAVKQVSKFAGWLGETSEILTRVALRERALKNGKSREEATFIARQAIDFAQGGTAVKSVDNFIPYLNAGVQGTRGILDSLRYNPVVTTFKIAQIVGFQAALTIWAKKVLEEEYDSISDADKVSKFVIPTPFFALDKNGNKRYYYIGIPKDQGQQVFATLGSEMAELSSGGKPSLQRVKMALENFAPANVTTLPPTLSATLGYIANKDFWQNKDIWRGRQVDPEFEQYASTPEVWKKAGSITGMSPVRLRKSFSKVVPNNPFVYIMGGIQGPLVAASDDSTLEKVGKVASKLPFIRRYLRLTQPVNLTEADIKEANKYGIPLNYPNGKPRPKKRIKEELKDISTEENNARQLNDMGMDVLMGQLRQKEINTKDLDVWMDKFRNSTKVEDRKEYERLKWRQLHKYPWSLKQ